MRREVSKEWLCKQLVVAKCRKKYHSVPEFTDATPKIDPIIRFECISKYFWNFIVFVLIEFYQEECLTIKRCSYMNNPIRFHKFYILRSHLTLIIKTCFLFYLKLYSPLGIESHRVDINFFNFSLRSWKLQAEKKFITGIDYFLYSLMQAFLLDSHENYNFHI